MDNIYTVTQSGVQLWQIYPRICTQEIIRMFCGSWQREDSIFRSCMLALKSYSWVKIVQLLCASAEFWIVSKVLNVTNNTILETT